MKFKKLLFVSLILFCSILACHACLVRANPGTYLVTLNLHKAASVGVVNTMSTAGQIFNTTSDWSGVTQENSSDTAAGAYFKVYFYLHPELPSTLNLNGVSSYTTFIKANDTAADVTLITTLNEIAAGGARTQLSTNSSVESVNATYIGKTNTHSTAAAIPTGCILELNITMGGSASNLTLYLGYDTAAVRSRMVLRVTDPVSISLSKDFSSYNGGSSNTLTATVTDVWGGYDIVATPVITFTNPGGTTTYYSTSALSTGAEQYSNTYTYTLVPSYVTVDGIWSGIGAVADDTGNVWSSSSFPFTVEIRKGSNWFSWGGDSGTQAADYTWLIVGAIIGIAALAYFTVGTKPSKTRKRR